MFFIVILVCVLSLPPADCQPATAVEVWPAGAAPSLIGCMVNAQLSLAARPLIAADRYIKTLCQRTTIGDNAA